jgi:hypothetical protein
VCLCARARKVIKFSCLVFIGKSRQTDRQTDTVLPFSIFLPLAFGVSRVLFRSFAVFCSLFSVSRPKLVLVRVQIQILVSEREKKKDGESYQLDDDDHDEQQESSDEICQSLLLAVSVAVSRL